MRQTAAVRRRRQSPAASPPLARLYPDPAASRVHPAALLGRAGFEIPDLSGVSDVLRSREATRNASTVLATLIEADVISWQCWEPDAPVDVLTAQVDGLFRTTTQHMEGRIGVAIEEQFVAVEYVAGAVGFAALQNVLPPMTVVHPGLASAFYAELVATSSPLGTYSLDEARQYDRYVSENADEEEDPLEFAPHTDMLDLIEPEPLSGDELDAAISRSPERIRRQWAAVRAAKREIADLELFESDDLEHFLNNRGTLAPSTLWIWHEHDDIHRLFDAQFENALEVELYPGWAGTFRHNDVDTAGRVMRSALRVVRWQKAVDQLIEEMQWIPK